MKPEKQIYNFEESLKRLEYSIGFQEDVETKDIEPSSVDFSLYPYLHMNCTVLSMHICISRSVEAPELKEIRRCAGVLQAFVSEIFVLLSALPNCLDIQVVESPLESNSSHGRCVRIEVVFETLYRNQLDQIFSGLERINSIGEIISWKAKLKGHKLSWKNAIDYGSVLAMRTSEKSVNERVAWCGAVKKSVESLYDHEIDANSIIYISERIQINLSPEYESSFTKIADLEDGKGGVYAAKLYNVPMLEWLNKNKG